MGTPKEIACELIERFIEFAFDKPGLNKITEESKFKVKRIAWNVADVTLDAVYFDKTKRRLYEDVKEEIENFDFNAYFNRGF